jgi:hypothetical protein
MKNYIIIFSTILALIINIIYISLIGYNINSGVQENYLLDSYYYNFLGDSLRNIPLSQFFSVLNEITPTINSIGIIIISYFISIFFEYTFIPILFGFIYYYFFNKDINKEIIGKFLCLALIGLCPLLFITSKESFLFIGIIILFRSFSKFGYKRFLYFIIGSSLIILARYEVILFLYLSIALVYVKIYLRFLIFSFAIIFLIFYYDIILNKANIYEEGLYLREATFCGFSYLPTCLSSSSNIVLILLSRAFFTLLLPLKWLYSGYELFYFLDNFYYFFSRLSQFLFAIFLIPLIAYFFRNKDKINNKLSKVGVYFFYSYAGFYSVVLFHQPTRQIQFALVILFLSVVLNSEKMRD